MQSTVSKADKGMEWRDAWSESYFHLGGKSKSNSMKACPLNGTKTLYHFGRIKGQIKQPENASLEQARDISENGLYAFLAIDELEKEAQITHKVLWDNVKTRVEHIKGNSPDRDEGTVKVVLALWEKGLIQNP